MSSKNDSGKFTLATQGGITLIGNLVGKVLQFVFVAVVTRLVTPAEYGIFTLGLSIVLFTQTFTSLNIYRSIDYFVPEFLDDSNYGQAKKTIQNVFLIGTVTSLLGAVVLFLVREQVATIFNEPNLAKVLLLLSFLIPLHTVYRTLIICFNSIKILKYRVIMKDLLNAPMKILGTAVLVSTGAELFALIGGYLFGVTLAIVCGLAFLFYEADWLRDTKPESISNKSLVSYSTPLVFAGVIYSLTSQIDYFIIGYFLDSTEVGQYRVAYMLAVNILITLNAITPIFKPLVAGNKSATYFIMSKYQLATRWVTMLTIPPALTLMLAPQIYLSLLFTDDYTGASAAVVALAVGYLLNASAGPEGMLLEGLGHTKLTFLNSTVLVCINGLLDILLVPRLGILGAGIATGSALVITSLLVLTEIYILRSITPLSLKLVRVWIAIVFPYTVGLIITSLDISNILISLVLPVSVTLGYVLGLRFTKGFSDDDREIALRIDERLGYSILYPIVS